MMKKLPIFTFLLILIAGGVRLAQAWQEPAATTSAAESTSTPTANPAPVEDPAAVNLLRESRQRLFDAPSLRATIKQRASFGGYQFTATGHYLAAKDFKYRLEYTTNLGQMQGQFVEVCDGQVIHTRRIITKTELNSQPLVREQSRRDLQPILRATRRHNDIPEVLQAAEVGLGGLPAVLASLERCMTFDAVREDDIEGQAVTIIRGSWKTERREELLIALGPLAGQLAGMMPDQVRVAFDRQTQLPRQIMYLQIASAERKTFRPMLVVDILDPEIGIAVSEQNFTLPTAPGLQEKDETESFLKLIAGASAAASAAAPSTQTPAAP